jgi:hypothetical protein
MSPDLHLYSYFSESQSNRTSKFFTNNSNSVSKSTIIKPSDTPAIPKWEIKERLDSFEFRTLKPLSQKLSFELFQKDFALWEKTSSEITKILTHFSEDLGEVMASFSSFNKKVYMDLFEFCRSALVKAKKKVDKYKATILSLNNDLLQKTERLALIKQIQLADNEKIEKEIREIFGDFVVDTDEIREKIKKLKIKDAVPAAEYLKEALEKLRVNQKIPDLDPTSPKVFDMSDYESTLNTRMRTIQVSTAQRIINYFESKDNFASKTTQTQEEFVQLKTFVEVKEALDKANIQLNSLNQQLENSRLKIIENENNFNLLLAEKGRLVTENLLKNNEVQNYKDREKFLKEKILKLKTEEKMIVVGNNPYIKENKPPSPVVSNLPGFFTINQRLNYHESDKNSLEEEKSEKNSFESPVLQIPSKRNSVMDESKSSFYSSVHSRSSESPSEKEELGELEVKNEEPKSEEDSESDEQPLKSVIKNEIKKIVSSKEVNEKIAKYEQNLKKNEGTSEKIVKKIFTSDEVEVAMKNIQKPKTDTKKIVAKPNLIEKNTEKLKILEKIEKVPKVEKIETSQIKRTEKKSKPLPSKSEKPLKTENLSKKVTEKPVAAKKVSFEAEKHTETKTTSAMLLNPDKVFSDELINHSLLKEDSFFKENPLDLQPNPLPEPEPKQENLQTSRKSPSLSSTSKSKAKSSSLDRALKPKGPSSFLPSIPRSNLPEKSKEQEQTIQDLLNYIEKLEKALKTMEEKLEESSKTGFINSAEKVELPKPEEKTREPLIYRMPCNPNNIYGLKGDRYFTSKGVFSTQPIIPDLLTSQFFSNFYHIEENN